MSANGFINQIKIENTIYDIRDYRVPAPEAGDANKAIVVDSNGNLVLRGVASDTAPGLLPQLTTASVGTQTQITKFLREDGTWSAPSYTPVDSALSSSSENPVQNKIVKAALDLKADISSLNPLSVTISTEKSSAQGVLEAKSITLDDGTTTSAYNFPENFDNVITAASASAFPASGASNVIYVANDTSKTYRWDTTGSEYVALITYATDSQIDALFTPAQN